MLATKRNRRENKNNEKKGIKSNVVIHDNFRVANPFDTLGGLEVEAAGLEGIGEDDYEFAKGVKTGGLKGKGKRKDVQINEKEVGGFIMVQAHVVKLVIEQT